MVTRYNPTGDLILDSMLVDKFGEWVLYDDYDEMKLQLEERISRLETLVECLEMEIRNMESRSDY
jgi:hypothetical protein